MTREDILSALWTLISASPAWQTASRRLQFWTEDQIEQPAIYMRLDGESFAARKGYGIPQEVVLKVSFFIYALTDAVTAVPSQAVTPLLDALDAAIADDPTEPNGRQTLGGLVQDVWREGETVIVTGEPDNQAAAVGQIHIRTVGFTPQLI